MIFKHLHKICRVSGMLRFGSIFYGLLIVMVFTSCIGNVDSAASQPVQGLAVPINCTTHSTQPVTLSLYYSSEKRDWIKAVLADFNSRDISACDGPITVKATEGASGQLMQEIINHKISPDIWSPAESTWITLLNEQWRASHKTNIIGSGSTSVTSLVNSPVVIAMWKQQAEALGWPTQRISWADIAALSVNPRGWAAHGHPEWGEFKFAHTNPNNSNSGLDAILAENYAAVSKVRGLTTQDITNKATKDFVTNIESSVIQYGTNTNELAEQMFTHDLTYLNAAVMGENLVIEANNKKKYPHMADSVVAIYPKEGTFINDHPFAILQADWVTLAKRTSALALRNFMLSTEQQRKALNYGFRPADPSLTITSPVDGAHEVDAQQPKTLLQLPTAAVVNVATETWKSQRRKVDVMLVLDRSGSMNDMVNGVKKIEAAKQGLQRFISLLDDRDGVGLTTFSDQMEVLATVLPLGPERQHLMSVIKGIRATGTTHLYDTIAAQDRAMQDQPSSYRKVLIVLTDGKDTVSKIQERDLFKQITPSGVNASRGVQIYTIAYGDSHDINVAVLDRIAKATGGLEYPGTPQSIQDVYTRISTFFA